jgi:hypothetical protein
MAQNNQAFFLYMVFYLIIAQYFSANATDTSKTRPIQSKSVKLSSTDSTIETVNPSDRFIKYWIWQHRQELWKNFGQDSQPSQQYTYPRFPAIVENQFFHSDQLQLDYRQSSIYIPLIVREYLDFKMGRDRYLPIMGTGPSTVFTNPIWYQIQMRSMRRE